MQKSIWLGNHQYVIGEMGPFAASSSVRPRLCQKGSRLHPPGWGLDMKEFKVSQGLAHQRRKNGTRGRRVFFAASVALWVLYPTVVLEGRGS